MVWGVLIAIAGVFFLCVILMGKSSQNSFSIISWIVALLMVVALSILNNRLIRTFEARSQSQDLVVSMQECLDACLPTEASNHTISHEEAHIIALAMKASVPQASRFIHASDFEGKTGASVSASFNKIIRKSTSRQIWNMIGWIVLIMLAGGVLMMLTAGIGGGGKTHRATGSSSYHPHDDF